MERLTEHHANKSLGSYMVCSGACIDDDFDCNNCKKLAEIVDRLSAYEDTGLEPGEIAEVQASVEPIPFGRFHDIMEAEREERLAVLPCKVCQDVFYLDEGFRNEICPATVVGVEINGYTPQCPVWLRIEYTSKVIGKHEYSCRADMMLRKTVFLTREEAEAALKKRDGV